MILTALKITGWFVAGSYILTVILISIILAVVSRDKDMSWDNKDKTDYPGKKKGK